MRPEPMDHDTWCTFGERAGMMEFDGWLPREEAERLARKIVEGRAEEAEQMSLLDDAFQQAKVHFRTLFGE